MSKKEEHDAVGVDTGGRVGHHGLFLPPVDQEIVQNGAGGAPQGAGCLFHQ